MCRESQTNGIRCASSSRATLHLAAILGSSLSSLHESSLVVTALIHIYLSSLSCLRLRNSRSGAMSSPSGYTSPHPGDRRSSDTHPPPYGHPLGEQVFYCPDCSEWHEVIPLPDFQGEDPISEAIREPPPVSRQPSIQYSVRPSLTDEQVDTQVRDRVDILLQRYREREPPDQQLPTGAPVRAQNAAF